MADHDSTVLTRPSNADSPETVLLSVQEVRSALAQITENYPELAKAMRICDAMLVRLETEKDQARMHLGLATERARKGDIAGTIEMMERASHTLGRRNSRQPLTA